MALFATSALRFQQQPPLRSLTPELRIVSHDSIPQTQLTSATGVLAAPDGFIFVVERCTTPGCIRMHDPNGRFRGSFGRPGQGPGELSANPLVVGAAGDTVLIYDLRLGNTHVFRRDGTLTRTHALAVFSLGTRQLRAYLSRGVALVEIGHWTGRTKDSISFSITA
jgi:hypothetical protein